MYYTLVPRPGTTVSDDFDFFGPPFVCIPLWDDFTFDAARLGAPQARASHLATQQVDVARMRCPWAMGLGPSFCKL